MSGKERHYYPGGNTSLGFYSYYSSILSQREANRIICIKGGPGVGKSTFMKKIGAHFLEIGEDVDFLHCSSDSGSLDGIILKSRKAALIDGTSPHIVDPVSPGAVDNIIHMGNYWNESALRLQKDKVIAYGEQIKRLFAHAYSFLHAAGSLRDEQTIIYENALDRPKLYLLTAEILSTELSHREISVKTGNVKKFFGSAISPEGLENHLDTLAVQCRRIYLFACPDGMSAERILRILSEGCVFRGFDTEEYYCPLAPEKRLEHVIVPALGLGFFTVNRFHGADLYKYRKTDDPQDSSTVAFRHVDSGVGADPPYALSVLTADLSNCLRTEIAEPESRILQDLRSKTEALLDSATSCIRMAKQQHDALEALYIPNMNFAGIDALREETIRLLT